MTDFTDGKYVDEPQRSGRVSGGAGTAGRVSAWIRRIAGPARGCSTSAAVTGGFWSRRPGAGPAGRHHDFAAAGGRIAAPAGSTCDELNYRNIFRRAIRRILADTAAFDAIIANGSLEHFVQATDAAAGRADAIYEEMFAICRRLLVDGGRLRDDRDSLPRGGPVRSGEDCSRAGGAARRAAMSINLPCSLTWFGGWYPEPGQLERCAAEHFELVDEEDGTHDYHLTSEYWLRQVQAEAGDQIRGCGGRWREQLWAAAAAGAGNAATAAVGPIVGVAISPAGADATVAADVGGEVVVVH